MSANNELVILLEESFEVHLNACVDNEFVPNRNTLLKKFNILELAIEYANAYCLKEGIEYGYYADFSCFKDTLNDKIINGVQRGTYKNLNGVIKTKYIKRFIKQIKGEFMRRFYGSDISNKDYEEYLKFIKNKAGDLK